MLHWIYCDIVYLCSHGSFSCCIGLIVTLFICVLMVLPRVALDWLWHCLSVFSWCFLMLHWIDCDIVYLCSHGSSSCCLGLIVTLFICVLMVLSHVALDWLWHCLSVFHGSSSCCIGLIVTLFIFVLMVLSHVALDWIWHCLFVFSWFFHMLHWIDCDIVYLCSHGSFSCCIGLIVTLFISVLMVLPHVVSDWLWHRLSVFLWFFLMLLWIECGIVYLCSHGTSSCCLWLFVTLFIFFLMVLLMLPWIDCDIVYPCSYESSSCCLWLIVTLIICVLMTLPYVAFDWVWHCLSVFSWFFLILPWIDCGIVICVLMVLTHVALDWSRHCLSISSWFYLMLPWIDCDIVYQYLHGSTSCCLGLIVTLFISILMVLPHVALDWLWHCLSVLLWFLLMLPWIDCDIVYQYSHGSSSCCLGLIVTLFISIFMVLPHVALDWSRQCLSVFSWFYLMLPWIDCDIVYQYSHGSSSCCLGLIVTLFISILMVLPHVALDWSRQCLSVFSWFFLMLPWIDQDSVYQYSHGSTSCCLGLMFISILMVLPHVALVCDIVCLCHQGIFMLHWTDCDIFVFIFFMLPHVLLDGLWHYVSVT